MTRISWVNVALGIWLATTAFVLHGPGTRVAEDVIAGLFVALAAVWAARAFRPLVSLAASWTVLLTGAWVASAPFVLDYERRSGAVANDVAVGLTIVGLAIANSLIKTHSSVGATPGPEQSPRPTRRFDAQR